jgi:hypothetical protein
MPMRRGSSERYWRQATTGSRVSTWRDRAYRMAVRLVALTDFKYYAQNAMGGGDIRILAVAFLWVGIGCAFPFAGLLAVCAVLHVGGQVRIGRRSRGWRSKAHSVGTFGRGGNGPLLSLGLPATGRWDVAVPYCLLGDRPPASRLGRNFRFQRSEKRSNVSSGDHKLGG